MCLGIAVPWSDLPIALLERHGLAASAHDRGGEREVRFLYRDRDPLLPVWREGQLEIVRWGNGRRHSRFLPCTGWTWQRTLEAGGWGGHEPELVDIPAALGLERGVWFRIRQGVRGMLVRDEQGRPVVYMVCAPASRYYEVMTRSARMPVLIGERI